MYSDGIFSVSWNRSKCYFQTLVTIGRRWKYQKMLKYRSLLSYKAEEDQYLLVTVKINRQGIASNISRQISLAAGIIVSSKLYSNTWNTLDTILADVFLSCNLLSPAVQLEKQMLTQQQWDFGMDFSNESKFISQFHLLPLNY